jgi:hypothetical protein
MKPAKLWSYSGGPAHVAAVLFTLGLATASCNRSNKSEGADPGHNSGASLVETKSEPMPGQALLAFMKDVNSTAIEEENSSHACDAEATRGFGWTRFSKNGKLARARVVFAANKGYDLWEYHFYYENENLRGARHRVGDWQRSTDGSIASSDVVVERSYEYEGDRAVQCFATKVATRSDQKEEALETSPRKPLTCEDAARLSGIARSARGPISDTSWLRELCGATDPSGEILAAIRSERAATPAR